MCIAVILENVRSVHNVGSIFRTADAVGAEKVFCCGITPGPLDRFMNVRADFAKVALGAERSVAWKAGGHPEEAIAKLRDAGWRVLAIEQAKHAIPYYAFPRGGAEGDDGGHGGGDAKVALILGSETEGVSPATLARCDGILEIPMRGRKESLNVAVAFGIVAFFLRYG
jgi:tRNA G18 (ribose-2'-O)-methylase SpoU